MRVEKNQLEDILYKATTSIYENINRNNDLGLLDDYLIQIGLQHLIPEPTVGFATHPKGKIMIFGASNISEKEIYGILKKYGIDKKRVKLCLGYKEAVKYPYKNLQYKSDTRLIIFGPIPHSTTDKGAYSSILNKLENEEGYPKVIRLMQTGITKTQLNETISREIASGYLVA